MQNIPVRYIHAYTLHSSPPHTIPEDQAQQKEMIGRW